VKTGLPPVATSRLRRLSEEEIELWLAVTRSVERRPGRNRLPLRGENPEPAPAAEEKPAAEKVAPASAAATPPAAPKPPSLAPMEPRLRQKLARGRAPVDAAIDLHGLTQHEAFAALQRFLIDAQRQGARLVLVVTGKGERANGDRETGVLRRNVPHWLAAPELRSVVIGFETATRPHGGSGALYVRIRRRDRVARTKPA
jgi:DNA-nicking Smr family endonuclease